MSPPFVRRRGEIARHRLTFPPPPAAQRAGTGAARSGGRYSTGRLSSYRSWIILNQMVKHNAVVLDDVFHALSHRARREIVHRLSGGEKTVGELAEPLHMSLAAASKHVRVLEEAGVLRRTVRGRQHFCSLSTKRLAAADGWLRTVERTWNERLDKLESLFAPGGEASS